MTARVTYVADERGLVREVIEEEPAPVATIRYGEDGKIEGLGKVEASIRFASDVGWVLRWYNGDEARDYSSMFGGGFTPHQREAKRFASKAEALEDTAPECLFGGVGPRDTIGWKAVRLVRTKRVPVPR